MKEYKIAIVGATGVVGRTFLKVLEEKKLPVKEYVLFASKRSAGKKLSFMGKEHIVPCYLYMFIVSSCLFFISIRFLKIQICNA